MIDIIYTHTGKIYVDRERKLEFLTVGDYGKENNIKADFLGLHKEINGVQHRSVDLSEKWVATISTQKGCPMHCQFCDCPKYGYHGDVSRYELAYMLETILSNEQIKHTKRFNVHYARMGEPTFNTEVLNFTEFDLKHCVSRFIKADTIHPVVSTMLPIHNWLLEDYLKRWCKIKNEVYGGEAGLQLSINSTDDIQRSVQFAGRSLPLKEIAKIAEELPPPIGRKYTLNFAVTAETTLDANVLSALFDKEKFIVKITPIHKTNSAVKNGFNITTEYSDFNVYRKFEQPLVEAGWDVIVFVPSEEEDNDRITCGNALITYLHKIYGDNHARKID